MGLENATYIDELYPIWPKGPDYKKEGAAHIRMVKAAIQNSFPSGNIDLADTGSWNTGQTLLTLVEDLGSPLLANNIYRSYLNYNAVGELTITTDWNEYESIWTFNTTNVPVFIEVQFDVKTFFGPLPGWVEIGIGVSAGSDVTALKRWYFVSPGLIGTLQKTVRGFLRFDPQDFYSSGFDDLDGGVDFSIFLRSDINVDQFSVLNMHLLGREADE